MFTLSIAVTSAQDLARIARALESLDAHALSPQIELAQAAPPAAHPVPTIEAQPAEVAAESPSAQDAPTAPRPRGRPRKTAPSPAAAPPIEQYDDIDDVPDADDAPFAPEQTAQAEPAAPVTLESLKANCNRLMGRDSSKFPWIMDLLGEFGVANPNDLPAGSFAAFDARVVAELRKLGA